MAIKYRCVRVLVAFVVAVFAVSLFVNILCYNSQVRCANHQTMLKLNGNKQKIDIFTIEFSMRM